MSVSPRKKKRKWQSSTFKAVPCEWLSISPEADRAALWAIHQAMEQIAPLDENDPHHKFEKITRQGMVILGEDIRISEVGFDRDDALTIDTFEAFHECTVWLERRSNPWYFGGIAKSTASSLPSTALVFPPVSLQCVPCMRLIRLPFLRFTSVIDRHDSRKLRESPGIGCPSSRPFGEAEEARGHRDRSLGTTL